MKPWLCVAFATVAVVLIGAPGKRPIGFRSTCPNCHQTSIMQGVVLSVTNVPVLSGTNTLKELELTCPHCQTTFTARSERIHQTVMAQEFELPERLTPPDIPPLPTVHDSTNVVFMAAPAGYGLRVMHGPDLSAQDLLNIYESNRSTLTIVIQEHL